jgi:hypothetical protein
MIRTQWVKESLELAMEIAESVSPPLSGAHDNTCPFCNGEEPVLRGLTTHKGSENSSSTLAGNLRDKPTYILEKGVVEDFPVPVVPAAHHLIPGNQAMDGHPIEQYTTTKVNGQLLEDIGYDINGKENGVWLPTFPDIYKKKKVSVKGKIFKGLEIGKQKWGDMSEEDKIPIVNIIQSKWGQAHIGDHKGTGYDRACRDRLTLLHNLLMTFWEPECKKSNDDNGKLIPPYGLVERINLQSQHMCNTIMPRKSPGEWSQWVSNYAKDFTDLAKKPFRGTISFG